MEKRPAIARAVSAWGPPLASATLLALAFSSLPLGWLVFVALVPWLRALRELDGKRSWGMGYRFGLLFALTQLGWIGTLAYRWTHSVALGIIPWILASILMAIYYGLMGVLLQRAFKFGVWWLAPVIWSGVEVFRSYIPMFAFPWNLLATPLTQCVPLAQLGHLGGIYLVSAWVLLGNVLLAAGDRFSKETKRKGGIAFGVAAVVSVVMFFLPAKTTNVPVTIAQTGIDMAFGDQSRATQLTFDAFSNAQAVARADKSAFVLFPEGMAGKFDVMPPKLIYPLADDVPMVFGGQLGTDTVYQTAFTWDHGTWQRVFKTRLVVFGEFVPFRDHIPFIARMFSLPDGDVSAGQEGVHPMKVGGRIIGPVICFEGMFPDISYRQELNGATMLTQLSIDDWYMDTSASEQIRQAAIWRSIETGLPLVRTASLGYSMLIDGKGVVRFQAPLRTRSIVTVSVPVSTGETPVWPVFTASLWALITFGVAALVLFFGGPKRVQRSTA